MSEVSSVTLKLDGVRFLRKLLKEADKTSVEVGIFEDADTRSMPNQVHDQIGNVALGYKHEFGKGGVHERSFLRVPLGNFWISRVNDEADSLADTLMSDGSKAMAERVGFIGQGLVDDAFNTAGFGDWPDTAESWAKMKGHSRPLIDTEQLRKSISSRVV